MSFKILKIGTKEYQEKIGQLKEEQLQLELNRWKNITRHNEANPRSMIQHYHDVQKRNKEAGIDPQSAKELCDDIRFQKINRWNSLCELAN